MKKIIQSNLSCNCMCGWACPKADNHCFRHKHPAWQTYTFRYSMKNSVAATLDTIKSLGITVLESGTNPKA
jgi:hypothetical protein